VERTEPDAALAAMRFGSFACQVSIRTSQSALPHRSAGRSSSRRGSSRICPIIHSTKRRSDQCNARTSGQGWRCGAAIPGLLGTVTGTPGWGSVFGVRFVGDRVRVDSGRTAVFVDARTRITGFDEYGLPRIAESDRIRATVRECTASGQRYKVVAESITNAGS
jgi:hypothetical protein